MMNRQTQMIYHQKARQKRVFIFLNFNNDVEENCDVLDHENKFHEDYTLKNIPPHMKINNACDVIRRLETKQNSDFNTFHKLKIQGTEMMLLQKSKQIKVSD